MTALEVISGAPALIMPGCNPFGHAVGPGGDRGPRHLMGGLYGPAYEGAKKWYCPNHADGRYRMTCQCDPPHRGQLMPLCYGHVRMIGRRMAGICPPCVMPPQARALHERIQASQARAAMLVAVRAAPSVIEAAVSDAEGLGLMMTDLVTRGIAHRCRLTLTEVSLPGPSPVIWGDCGNGNDHGHSQMGQGTRDRRRRQGASLGRRARPVRRRAG